MIGEHASDKRCPLCGGFMKNGLATIPFIVGGAVFVVKDVPAELCQSCHEPFMTGEVVDRLTTLLNPLSRLNAEVSVLTCESAESVTVLIAEERPEYKLRTADEEQSSGPG